MTIPALRLAVFVLGLLLVPVPLRAEEPSETDLGKRAHTFAAPDAAQDLHLELDIVAGGEVVGRARIAASAGNLPDAKEPTPCWHVRESFAVGEGEEAVGQEFEAWLDPTLEAVRGRLVQAFGEWKLAHAFRRDGEAYEVEVSGDGREARRKRAEREGHALTGLTSLILLAREVAADARVFRARRFAPEWDHLVAQRPFTDARIETGPGTWRGRSVRRLHLTCPDDHRQITVILDREAPDVLHVHWKPAEGPAFDLRPRTADEPEAEDDVLARPAKTARAAAMRTTLAFDTADADLFEAVVHWGKLREYGESYVRGKVTPDEFRAAILEQFRKNVPSPMPRDAACERILEHRDAFRVEMQGETRAVVTLPSTISPMKLTVELVEGVWYLVRLPHG